MEVLVVLVIIGCIIWAVTDEFSINKRNKEQAFEKQKITEVIVSKLNEAKNQNFNPTQTIWSHDEDRLLGLDDNIKKIGYFTPKEYKFYTYRDILRSEILVDGVQVTKTSRSSQLGGAILGGILAGGVGAIIGGLSASQETQTNINRIDINVIVNDVSSPQLIINVFNSRGDSKEKMDYARHWHNLMSVLIRQADLEDKEKEDTRLNKYTNNETKSLADELEKLASLLEKGLLTKEEFDKEKSNLLT